MTKEMWTDCRRTALWWRATWCGDSTWWTTPWKWLMRVSSGGKSTAWTVREAGGVLLMSPRSMVVRSVPFSLFLRDEPRHTRVSLCVKHHEWAASNNKTRCLNIPRVAFAPGKSLIRQMKIFRRPECDLKIGAEEVLISFFLLVIHKWLLFTLEIKHSFFTHLWTQLVRLVLVPFLYWLRLHTPSKKPKLQSMTTGGFRQLRQRVALSLHEPHLSSNCLTGLFSSLRSVGELNSQVDVWDRGSVPPWIRQRRQQALYVWHLSDFPFTLFFYSTDGVNQNQNGVNRRGYTQSS